MLVQDLPTPALLVERSRLEANLDAMQARADQEGVALRPHVKTHKTAELARLQVERGARGLTVATVAEAEAFAGAGFSDLVAAREVVAPGDLARLVAVAQGGVRLAVCVDTPAGARAVSEAFAGSGLEADLLVEVDTGHGRCGLPWHAPDEAVAFVQELTALPGLRLRGLLTHGGHVYLGPRTDETSVEALDRAMVEERDRLLTVAEALGATGLLDPAEHGLSLGSTPTLSRFINAERGGFRITEVRPGNYVFHDAQQVALGSATLGQCALTVNATTFSKRRHADGTEHAFVDAGKKTLTTDTGWNVEGHGALLYSPRTMVPNPHAALVALSEEHGWIYTPGGAIYDVGDQVRIVPNHACVAVATQAKLYLVDEEEVLEEWPVLARGAA